MNSVTSVQPVSHAWLKVSLPATVFGQCHPSEVMENHRGSKLVLPFPLPLMQLGATVFPYYLFSYFMCSNGIFRTLVFYTIGIFRHTKMCLYLSTCYSSDFPNFFFIDKVCIFLKKSLFYQFYCVMELVVEGFWGNMSASAF